jgi:UPF0176 protein
MEKVILFYKFTPLKDPEAIRLWQKALGEKFNLKGRVIIADHGINGTMGGELKDLKGYIKETKSLAQLKDMTFKWSEGQRNDFPRLSIKVRSEIVTFDVADKIKVNEKGIQGGGIHLKPKQVHALVNEKKGDVVFFDGRNAYEAEIGKFKDAVVPSIRHTRDFAKELTDPKYDDIKDKPVVTYCTGGIRCEVLSMLMKQNGFKEVYQIDGGIAKYGEEYGDEGLWEGSLYVFDKRLSTQFSDKAVDIGGCTHCGNKTSNFINCADKSCNDLVLVCEDCNTHEFFCVNHTNAAALTA